MKRNLLFVLFAGLLLLAGCTNKENGGQEAGANLIRVETPERPAGQEDMVAFAAPKLETVRVGFIGLGMRGPSAVERFCFIPGTEVLALCDLHADRAERTNEILLKHDKPAADLYSGSADAWRELVERPDLDLIYIAADWAVHVEMAKYAMEQGKHVAVEVPVGITIDDLWTLVDTSEKTRKHCMMLENCVYDFFELTVLNMVQEGLLGEIVYAEGGYIHQLEDFWNYYENDWRLAFNKAHRGDVYPTHGMGPACQVLDIHRGDKMNYLVSMDADPVSLPAWVRANRAGEDGEGRQVKAEDADQIKNGQHTLTLIRTEKGKTIEIHHDVTTPRPYSRQYNIAGTQGYASKYPRQLLALQGSSLANAESVPDHEDLNAHRWLPAETQQQLMEEYKHPIHKELEEMAREVGGHGGMDFIMDYRLVYCLQNGLPLDMDVYDLAEWSCLVPLSAISLENGSMPVEVPDFTRGAWNKVQGFRHAFAE
ncbi:MAG: Gfo/Idh/MocA family oxidoreductase [Porphyromonas sp.]|nr:Gfo/Idh/MocA family oxidoreductase [Porphyromonas sp.]